LNVGESLFVQSFDRTPHQPVANMDLNRNQKIEPALEATLGQSSAHSLATGPVMEVPFISPLLLAMTPALSSQ
jgi:hypothetical protein